MSETVLERLSQSRAQRRALGKALRAKVRRSSHAGWQPATDRPDPLELLRDQDKDRLQHLVPIKYGRMAASPFAFLRGSAVVMAADLATTPVMGETVVLCGDAHLSNFGLYASPERDLVFDINDFDECFPGPWEWDVKRLAASVVVAARENGFDDEKNRTLAADTVRTYRRAMRYFAKQPTLDVWYFRVGADQMQALFKKKASKQAAKQTRQVIKKAQSRTQEQTLEKMTEVEDGRRQILNNPPLLVPLRSGLRDLLLDEGDREKIGEEGVMAGWREYLGSLPEERRFLLERFNVVDMALRVGGVGSVGTRCAIVLLEGGGDNEGLILQLKEAGPSVLEAYLPPRDYRQHAERVVLGQRLMQATSDPFLGWHQSTHSGYDYYWRQLKDMKGSVDVTKLDESGFRTYAEICAFCLARAHARTGDTAMIAGYLGGGEKFDRAVADFAVAYADQTEKDHAALVQAIKDGRIPAEIGV